MNMFKKKQSLLSIQALLIFAFWFSLTAQKPSYQTQNDEAQKSILVAKGKSGLEYNVAQIVQKKFQNYGYTVDVIAIKDFNKQSMEKYDAILLMNAIKRKALSRKVQQAVSEMSEKENSDIQPYIFIATLSGDEWSEKQTTVDATTMASRKENAEGIAQKLIRRLEGMLIPEK